VAAYATLLQDLATLVDAVTGLDRVKIPVSDLVPAQVLGGGFTVRLTGGSDTAEMRSRARVRDSHDAEIVLWYLIDHNDAMATDKAALDDLVAVRNALYTSGAISAAVVSAWAYGLSVAAGGEILRAEITITLEHTTSVS